MAAEPLRLTILIWQLSLGLAILIWQALSSLTPGEYSLHLHQIKIARQQVNTPGFQPAPLITPQSSMKALVH